MRCFLSGGVVQSLYECFFVRVNESDTGKITVSIWSDGHLKRGKSFNREKKERVYKGFCSQIWRLQINRCKDCMCQLCIF